MNLRESIAAAVRCIEAAQERDGSFALAESASRPPATRSDNLFSTAMVVGLLSKELRPETLARAAAYLVARRDSTGFWAWLADGTMPADADDTACCLGALACAGAHVDRTASVKLLRRFWRLGGPFQTWMTRRMWGWGSRERDDAVVNCNVLWAIRVLGGTSRRAEQAAATRIVARTPAGTRYYCSAASVAWAAARVGIATPHLVRPADAALANRPLDCALWLLASQRQWSEGAALLLAHQEADGGWPGEAWLHDHAGDWESRSVTTAFAIAALTQTIAPD